jgi:hypothetical protein
MQEFRERLSIANGHVYVSLPDYRLRVQGWIDDDGTDEDVFQAVSCLAYQGVHSKTGKSPSDKDHDE